MPRSATVFALSTLGVCAAAAAPLAAQPVTEDWVATHPGLGSVGVVAGPDGAIYVAGRSELDADHGFRSDIVTIRYDLDGNVVWLSEFDETDDGTNGTDLPSWLTLDPDGNVVVTGRSFIDATGDDILTLKYDPAGNLLWKARSTQGMAASRVATDAAGNVYVTGRTSTSDSLADFITIKYDPDGAELWTRITPVGFGDAPFGLSVTPEGEVVVAGESSNGVSCFDATTIALDTDGNERWVRTWDSGVLCSLDSAADVARGPGGEIYVGGYADNGDDTDFLVIRYDADGNEVWVRTIDRPLGQLASRLRVDRAGNPVLAGVSDSDFTALKLDPAGSLLWLSQVDISGEDVPFAMVLGPDDAVYLTGYATIGSAAIATAKLDAGGNLQWTATYDQPVFSDIGWGIALDATGNVIVSGQSDIVTIRYLQEPPVEEVSITVTPHDAPIVIPPGGGSFSYDLSVTNLTDVERPVDLWIELAFGAVRHVLGPVHRTLAAGGALGGTLTQAIPGGAPAGVYSLTANVGTYPLADASDGFPFEKAGAGAAPGR